MPILKPAVTKSIVPLVVIGASFWYLGCQTDAGDRQTQYPELPVVTISERPSTVIGGADERDGYSIGRFGGAVLLSDRIAVTDGLAGQVRFYDFDGRLLGRVGRIGIGPGEFRAMRNPGAIDDSTIAVWDPQLQRLTKLTANGVTRILTPDLSAAQTPATTFTGALETGDLIFRGPPDIARMRTVQTGIRRDTVTFLILSDNGASTGSVFKTEGTESWFVNEGMSWGYAPVIFGSQLMQVVARGGLVFGRSDSPVFRLVRYVSGGVSQDSFTLSMNPVQADPREVEPERQKLLDELNATHEREGPPSVLINGKPVSHYARDVDLLERAPSGKTLPLFRDLVSDGSGGFWMETYARAGEALTQWIHIEAVNDDFIPTEHVLVPSDVTVEGIRGDFALVSRRDALDRIELRLYILQRASR